MRSPVQSVPMICCRGLCRRRCSLPVVFQQPSSFAFSTMTRPPPLIDDVEQPPVDTSATIVRGPSLLTSTGVHRPSPSLFHLPGLRSLPFWTAPTSSFSPQRAGQREGPRHRVAFNDPLITAAISHVEASYDVIRSEYFAAVLGKSDEISLDEDDVKRRPLEPDYDVTSRGGEHASDALHTGSWDWHSCMLNGIRNKKFGERCPKTVSVVDEMEKEGILFGTPFGFCFFSTLHGRSSIKAHTGPMNLRLRIHLPLVVPRDDDAGGDSPSSSASSSGTAGSSSYRARKAQHWEY